MYKVMKYFSITAIQSSLPFLTMAITLTPSYLYSTKQSPLIFFGCFAPSWANIQENTGTRNFKSIFFEIDHPQRTLKHVSDPLKGSAAKRLNMFMRWMVRSNTKGVDFGIWKQHSPAHLSIPLDVHTGNIARKLNLIRRKQNDSKTLGELDKKLRKFDPVDPVKYDYALFGLGVFEKF